MGMLLSSGLAPMFFSFIDTALCELTVSPPIKMKTLLNVNTGELLMENKSSWISSTGDVFLKVGNGFMNPKGELIQQVGNDFSNTNNLDFFTKIDHDNLC